MHATTSRSSVRRVAATSALALVALSGTAGTAVAAPGNPGNGKGNGSHNAAPQADKPQGKAKGYGKSKGRSGSKGNQGKPGGQGNQGNQGNQGAGGSGGSGGSQAPGSAGAPADKADKGSKGSPPGNNGTVKIAPLGEMDGIPNNSPHVGCDFQVEWYGFDEGADIISKVSFAMQAPTSDVGLTVNGPGEVFVGEDPASGAGQDPDGVQAYSLSFDGEPHPKQGYHVKLTINTPRSNGSDVKHKVFWVEDCEDSYPSGGSSTGEEDGDSLTGPDTEDGTEGGYEEGESGTESGSVDGGDSGESTDSSDSSASSDSAGMSGTSGSSDSSSSSTSSSSAASVGSEGSARSGVSQDVTTSGASDTPGSVDAGLSGSDIARGSLLGLLVAAAGGALLWYARRTRAHG